MSEQKTVPVEPSEEQIQIVFNWLMFDEDKDSKKGGWWGGPEDVEYVKTLIRQLLAAAPPRDEPTGCPCTLIEPCSSTCSCANPIMSGGCARCCKYGSLEQRKEMAKCLALKMSGEPTNSVATQHHQYESRPCCGEYATCLRPCTPRGRWLAVHDPANNLFKEDGIFAECQCPPCVEDRKRKSEAAQGNASPIGADSIEPATAVAPSQEHGKSELPLSADNVIEWKKECVNRGLIWGIQLCEQALAAIALEKECKLWMDTCRTAEDNLEKAEAESANLRHDITRYVQHNSELLAELAKLRTQLGLEHPNDEASKLAELKARKP